MPGAFGGLLLKNVRPVAFPGRDGDALTDILVEGGVIAPSKESAVAAAMIRDFHGAYLSPAWIDLLAEIAPQNGIVRTVRDGAATGVPILVDAGSSEIGNLARCYEGGGRRKRELVLSFLDVGAAAQTGSIRTGQTRLLMESGIDAILGAIDMYPVAGLAIHATREDADLTLHRQARSLCRALCLPLFMSFPGHFQTTGGFFDELAPGDIAAAMFRENGIAEEADTAPLLHALRRGVFLGLGDGPFLSHRFVRLLLAEGRLPLLIGGGPEGGGPGAGLSLTLSKMICLGMSLRQAIECVTVTARRALRLPPASLEGGEPAEFTLFTAESADWSFTDAYGDTLRLVRYLMPRAVYWNGDLSPAAPSLPGRVLRGGVVTRISDARPA